MNRFTIHYCNETKDVTVYTTTGFFPDGTAYTASYSGGNVVVRYEGCLSSVTVDEGITYTINSGSSQIIFSLPYNGEITEKVWHFTANWCLGTSTTAIITQSVHNYLINGTAYTMPSEGGTFEIEYHGCVSSITTEHTGTYSIDAPYIVITLPRNFDSEPLTFNYTINWCNGEHTNFEVLQEAHVRTGYLTFKSLTNSKYAMPNISAQHVLYSIDSGSTWQELKYNQQTYTVYAGSTIMWKGNLVEGTNCRFTSTGMFEAYGNPLSIFSGDTFDNVTTVPEGLLQGMFLGCGGLTSAENLYLKARNVGESGYYAMFKGCTSLTTAPTVLPATTIGTSAYTYMFSGCTSLVSTPELPATTMSKCCYYYMFAGCTSLTTAPVLSATTMSERCYANMFSGCTSLVNVQRALPATTLASRCYAEMFKSCTSLRTAPELPATTLAEYCYEGMFSRCTSLTTAPELPATTLEKYCYSNMFYNCTSLTTAPELPATTLKNGLNVASYCYYYMFCGCSSLATAPELPATTLAEYCYKYMFGGCTSLVNAQSILPSTSLKSNCYDSMFFGCTSLATAPELPALTLVSKCYDHMFYNCSNLNYIKAMFTTNPSRTYTSYWVSGVSATGTFVRNINATWDNGFRSNYSIPNGWTVQTANP